MNAPRSWPNSSLSARLAATEPQSKTTNGPFGARALLVNGVGHHVLAGPGLADERDRDVGPREALEHVEELVHRRRAGGEPTELARRGGRAPQGPRRRPIARLGGGLGANAGVPRTTGRLLRTSGSQLVTTLSALLTSCMGLGPSARSLGGIK